MGNLFFPQLSCGAVAQYPIHKTQVTRSIMNRLPDGTVIASADPSAAKLTWELRYTQLSADDVAALQAHFQACCGPYHAFTFIDPTDNILASSVDLTTAIWQKDPQIAITSGATDPTGATDAFVVTNNSAAVQRIWQDLTVPASYQYCFSFWVRSTSAALVSVSRKGVTTGTIDELQSGGIWSRVVSSGRLSDSGDQFTVGLNLSPGQQLFVFGFQLEAQIQPSMYRATFDTGGVYPFSHWASDSLPISSDAPGLFSTAFSVTTNI
jgi:hypothetical protein